MTVESFVIQLSAERDRGDQERAVVAEGYVPVVVFANGPENAFLVKTRPDDVEAALEAAWDRIDHPKAKRIEFRASVFAAMAQAVETDFSAVLSETDFPNDAVILFAEALADNGVDTFSDVDPCAVRFDRAKLGEPEFELAV
jgi:hypothetical protein